MPQSPTDVTKNLDTALTTYSNDARAHYDGAHTKLNSSPQPTGDTLKALQGELMGAFSQLSNAARVQADESERAGMAAVVQLMQATADVAEKVCTKLVTVLHADPGDSGQPTQTEFQFIDRLTSTLQALAELSPSAVWSSSAASAPGT
jgi:hypothetical protein